MFNVLQVSVMFFYLFILFFYAELSLGTDMLNVLYSASAMLC